MPSRRQVLSTSLALAASGLAGCLSGGAGGADGTTTTGTGTTTDGGTTTATETTATETTAGDTTTAAPSLSSSSLSTTSADCGSGANEATVSFDDGAGSVAVSGTVGASDPCHAASLASAGYDAEASAFVVVVETVDDGDVCSQCIADVGYEAAFGFDGGLPGRVVVRHDGMGEMEMVAETSP